MKLSKKTNRGGTLQLNMTPMIDCVFLLLIFFMSCTQVSLINLSPLNPPEQKGTEDQSEATITINVDQAGDIIITQNVYTLPEAVVLITETIAEKKGKTDLVNVVLRPDAQAKSKVVNDLMRALNKLEVTNVKIPVRPPR
ncbi:MAG: biopolymer transporter ExbD [Planctomycetales bacterium]|nr:biopolymer transporter ExbD [Planctomycetales bacterium]